jgi:hypothetical protein
MEKKEKKGNKSYEDNEYHRGIQKQYKQHFLELHSIFLDLNN